MTDGQFLGLLIAIEGGVALITIAIYRAADEICDRIEKVLKRNE